MGSQVVNTLCLLLRSQGLEVGLDGVAVVVQDVSPEELMKHLEALVETGPVDAVNLAEVVEDKVSEKHDHFLSEELSCWNYASSFLATQSAWETIQRIAAHLG
jgi:hypothetical protein